MFGTCLEEFALTLTNERNDVTKGETLGTRLVRVVPRPPP